MNPNNRNDLEIQYSHNNKNLVFRKCTLCNKANMLIKLPDELQEYSKKKNFESWFCCNCIQVVNFVI